jgi:hypothetical protein
MRFPVTIKKLIDGKVQARCIGTVAGEVSVVGDSREEVLERATRSATASSCAPAAPWPRTTSS